MKDFLPILKSLKSNYIAALLFITQVAITFTILVNAIFLALEKREVISRPSGLDEHNIFYVATNLPVKDAEKKALLEQDLLRLNAINGVTSAAVSTGLPLTGWGRLVEVATKPDTKYDTFSGYYGGDAQLVKSFGVELIAGRHFKKEEELTARVDGYKIASEAMVTKALAKSLFDENWEQIVGQTLYINNKPQRIVGVVKTLQSAWPSWVVVEHGVISAVKETDGIVNFVIRTESGVPTSVVDQTLSYLMETHGRKIDKVEMFTDVKARAYSAENAASKTLLGVIAGLLLVTTLGIYGQSRYGIVKRFKLIGIRRAMGASKGEIIRYFMLENVILTCLGVILGIISAIVLSVAFSNVFELGTVPMSYMIYGSVCTLLLGQVAVFYPAFRAAQLPPAVATRIV
ncbi:FtsX-like permease family protein [Pseudoalteromonas luteoviolacea]|uniref:ABC transporter permease n=1 Tax=Pseudoalteromonas luteoviolacea TaxID=43657 RepID=UPI001B372CA5|nr:FtsX-like permease family protein [Pseudoalteromonas luteoviolacea]MBQ4811605.1 FtsX-like permease family protein [Pseudoalteromonas luteoviolacea]